VVSYSASAIHDQHGKLQGVLAAARDVTERRRIDRLLLDKNAELETARAAADKANHAKSEFLSSMSHELRSPLNAILGFAQLIETEVPSPPPALLENVAQILKGGWHLLTLINEILDLARVESGQVPLSMEPVPVADVLLECQAMMGPQAQQRGLKLSFAPTSSGWFVIADRTRLKQVLINLLSNAIKYNSKHGTVVVSCEERAPNRLRLSVTDTGAGLSPPQVDQLFQAFNRLGQDAGGEEGTGIGLVVAKRLVELMDGEIGVVSTVGQGSVFWVELTKAVAPQLQTDPEPPAATAVPSASLPARTPTVLYIEDNPANLLLVTQIVARFSTLRLISAVDGYGGIELARTAQPDVILMDINLPGINGLEAMRIVKADPRTSHIPVVALSANAMPRDVARGLEAGFFRYITKPIKVHEFVASLKEALASIRQSPGGPG
jgi:signal transduction histidine kinase/ActR/RegA family two-component response regulator